MLLLRGPRCHHLGTSHCVPKQSQRLCRPTRHTRRTRPHATPKGPPPPPQGDDPQRPSVSTSEVPVPDIGFEGGEQAKNLQLPKEVIEQLRYSVFGFDSFFVTGIENYEQNGVLFKGNLRGDPQKTHAQLRQKLQALLGDEYTLYLLETREAKPVVVVIPTEAVLPPPPAIPQAALAALFAAATLITSLNCNGFPLLATFDDATPPLTTALLLASLPGTLAFLGLLAVHEWGHQAAARKVGVRLAPPVLLPAGLGLLGSFGAITSPMEPVPSRAALLEVSVSGPLYGTAAALAATVAGLGLTAAGVGGVAVEPSAFEDSLLVGLLGKAVLGDALAGSRALDLNPLLLSGWAALLVNALNSIPVGDLDGGRVAAGLWGRRAGTALSTVTLLVLGLAGIIDTLALLWVLVVVFLQRGPVAPQLEELSAPQDSRMVAFGIAALVLPLLVLLPCPASILQGGL